jgi:hypothetical protein
MNVKQEIALKEMQHKLVWQSFEDAQTIAEDNGYFLRVVSEDGNDYIYTMDYQEGRLNVKLDSGIVTDVVFFG